VAGVADYSATGIGEGWHIVDDGHQRWRVAVASDGASTWVFVNGHVARIEPADLTATRGRARSRGDAGVMSPMPATVVSINTAPGKAVSEGETVIVLEAMKMELPIKAPKSGVVKAVHCAKGDLVQPGVVLLELE
jgi:3-methylcrotonyl-CoA carboxylase alpha subunit